MLIFINIIYNANEKQLPTLILIKMILLLLTHLLCATAANNIEDTNNNITNEQDEYVEIIMISYDLDCMNNTSFYVNIENLLKHYNNLTNNVELYTESYVKEKDIEDNENTNSNKKRCHETTKEERTEKNKKSKETTTLKNESGINPKINELNVSKKPEIKEANIESCIVNFEDTGFFACRIYNNINHTNIQ
ncbi:hypothetical protein BDAP_000574 [Binucleata daphniae]